MISLPPTCKLPTYTIPVVDDDLVLRKILIRCMKNDRHNIVEARDGQEAIEGSQKTMVGSQKMTKEKRSSLL